MLDVETLNYKERESYQKIIEQYKVKQLTIADMKEHITSALFSAIRELVEIDKTQDERNIHLKARCKNYLLLLDMLTVPEVAEKQLNQALSKLEKRVK